MLGYGQTDKPLAIADYTLKKLADDLAALLDTVNIPKVVRTIHATHSPFTVINSDASVITRSRLVMTGALLSWADSPYGTRTACSQLLSKSKFTRVRGTSWTLKSHPVA